MKAVKGNREYTISEHEKEQYIKDGFDIYDNGEKIAGGKRTVTYEEYVRVKTELEALKKEKAAGNILENKSVDDLKEYAAENGIDLGSATSKKAILEKINSAEQE